MSKVKVLNQEITLFSVKEEDFISLTDIAKYKDEDNSADIIRNWLRNRNTLEFLGIWEKLNNPEFKLVEFDQFKNEAGLNSFTIRPQQWIDKTNAVGIISKSGRYGGTYAHKDIAFEFASWVSVEFKLYLIKEFQRLKEEERKTLGWDIKRNLAKINYKIHTDAIKSYLIPVHLTPQQTSIVYASEADVLNLALFGKTAGKWREENPEKDGNIRDYADVSQLVCLSNLENLNAVFIQDKIPQSERLIRLNEIAIKQMIILSELNNVKSLDHIVGVNKMVSSSKIKGKE